MPDDPQPPLPDLGGLLGMAMDLQQQVAAAQEQAAANVVEGQAGGGAVRIEVTGGFEFRSVTIAPEAIDPDDAEMLQDLVLAALHDAVERVYELQTAANPLAAMGGLDLGSLDLGGLTGALGVPQAGALDAVEAGPRRRRRQREGVVAVYAGPVQDLIDELGRLPGVGPKSAQRIAFHLLKLPREDALRLARSISEVKDRVTFCRRCYNIAEGSPERRVAGEGPECGICADPRRDAHVVCVVEEPRDIVAVEKTGEFKGRYHVLHGAISPIEGIGPDQLRVKELLARIEPEDVTEIILCTNPNLEGEATALYLGRLIKPLGISVTRIASGMPVGGDLEYADELTLGRALEGRREVDGD